MPSVTQILPNGGRTPNPQPREVQGRVSSLQPLPSDFTHPLFVVLDDYDPDKAYRVDNWPAIHGSTLPAFNAEVQAVFNQQGVLRVTWWAGVWAA